MARHTTQNGQKCCDHHSSFTSTVHKGCHFPCSTIITQIARRISTPKGEWRASGSTCAANLVDAYEQGIGTGYGRAIHSSSSVHAPDPQEACHKSHSAPPLPPTTRPNPAHGRRCRLVCTATQWVQPAEEGGAQRQTSCAASGPSGVRRSSGCARRRGVANWSSADDRADGATVCLWVWAYRSEPAPLQTVDMPPQALADPMTEKNPSSAQGLAVGLWGAGRSVLRTRPFSGDRHPRVPVRAARRVHRGAELPPLWDACGTFPVQNFPARSAPPPPAGTEFTPPPPPVVCASVGECTASIMPHPPPVVSDPRSPAERHRETTVAARTVPPRAWPLRHAGRTTLQANTTAQISCRLPWHNPHSTRKLCQGTWEQSDGRSCGERKRGAATRTGAGDVSSLSPRPPNPHPPGPLGVGQVGGRESETQEFVRQKHPNTFCSERFDFSGRDVFCCWSPCGRGWTLL